MKSMMRGLAALLAASMTMTCAGMFPATAADDAVKALPLGTYEVEDFDGVETWTSVYEDQIPGYSGDGFAYLTATPITFYVDAPEETMYDISVRAAQILSQEGRMQTIRVNGIDYTYDMAYTPEWTDMSLGVFRLKEGVNEITFTTNYGYCELDTVTIQEAVFPTLKGDATPCDPKATPEAASLLKYLNSVYGEYILSGQQEIYGGGHGVQTSIRYEASSDQCIDGDGKVYEIDKDSYDTDEQGNKFPWHCMDETGFVYTYNTQNRCYAYNDYEQECRYLYELTGEYPAIRGFDFNTHNPGYAWEDGVTDRMIDWAKNKNGICTASWHVTVPKEMSIMTVGEDGSLSFAEGTDWQSFTYALNSDFKTSNVLVEGTDEYYYFQECMRLLAVELQKLQDAGVPVLFRPLHEAEGNSDADGDGSGSWFWWSKEGTEVYHQIWKLLYTTLTEKYDLHNIIWEQNLYAWSDASANWYTGDEWVDIVGFDKYNTQYNRHDGNTSGPNFDAESKTFWSLVDFVDNGKLVAMPENDSIPSMDNMLTEKAMWLYFCTWYDGESGAPQFISGDAYQTQENVKAVFQSEKCITLSELPANLYSMDVELPTQEATPASTEIATGGDVLEVTVWGDADDDGDADIMDVIAVNKDQLGSLTLKEQGKANADVDRSGDLSFKDAVYILQSLVDLVELPVESK